MKRRAALAHKLVAIPALALVLGATAYAQTVRPVIVQYHGVARGKIELVNNSLHPLSVVLEPMSFKVAEDGNGIYGPLEGDIHLKLSAMSFRIPPQQSRFVFYEAKSDRLPAWFVIYSVFAAAARPSGVNIQIEIPHTVYLLQKQPLGKPDVAVESFRYLPDQHRVVVLLANNSSKLGRAVEWQVSSKGTKTSNPGFPLLPQSRRRLELEWNSPARPDVFRVRFEHFTLEETLNEKQE
jgi:hypothetical protein